MTKLDKEENNCIAKMLHHEFSYLEQMFYQGMDAQAHTSKETTDSLTRKELILRSSKDRWRLTNIGRKAAIDLLHDDAAKEMEGDSKHRTTEEGRIKAESRIKKWIVRDYPVFENEVDVTASYWLGDMPLRYSIDLAQKHCGRLFDLVSIGWTHDEYTVDTTATSLNAKDAKRMGELMLIATKIIESGILMNPITSAPPASELTDIEIDETELGERTLTQLRALRARGAFAELTDEMILLLEMLIQNPIRAMYEATLPSYQELIAMEYVSCIKQGVAKYIYQITDTGRAALKAHQTSAEVIATSER